MATPTKNRSWKTGKKGARKKKANPQVAGLILTLCVLAAILIWAIWPRPMVQVQLFVITPDEEAEYQGGRLVRYHTAKHDNEAIFNVFEKIANQVQSVVSANQIPVTKFKGMSADEFKGRKRIGVVFANALSRAVLDDSGVARLQLQFGSDRQTIGFEDLVQKFKDAQFREIILLLEVAHEQPKLTSEILAVEGPALLKAAVDRLAETDPDLRLTVISSTSEMRSSYPFLTAAGELNGLEEFDKKRPVITGTAFGQSIAEILETGDFWTIEDLSKQITTKVENYVSENFQGEQIPKKFSTYTSAEPVDIFREKHDVSHLAETSGEEDESAAEESAAEKASEENQEEVELSPDENYFAYLSKISDLLSGHELNSMAMEDHLQLNQFASDLKYVLDHGDLDTFEIILDQAERLILQIQSAATTGPDIQQKEELQVWIPSIDLDSKQESGFFNDLVAEINDGEDARNASVVEKLKSQDAKEQLLQSFLVACELAFSEIDNDSEEAVELRKEQISDWRLFFQRLSKKAGWHNSKWPHQFLLASELLLAQNTEWTDPQFASFLKLISLRSKGLQFASGWNTDGTRRLNQSTFIQVTPALKDLLKETVSAERSFVLGQIALGITENHLLEAEKILESINASFSKAGDRYDFLTLQRLKILEDVEKVALQHNSNLLSSEELEDLSGISEDDLLDFQVTHIPSASFSRTFSKDDAIALMQLTTEISTQTPQQLINEIKTAMNRFRPVDIQENVPSVLEEYRSPMVHQGVWLSFWSIRALSALSDKVDDLELMSAWHELVQVISDEESIESVAAKRSKLSALLSSNWAMIQNDSIVTFKPAEFDDVAQLIAEDLERHSKFGGSKFSGRYRSIFAESPRFDSQVSLPPENKDIMLSDGSAKLDLQIPDGTLVYFHPDGVRIKNSKMRNLYGWQIGAWDNEQTTLEITSQFNGSAQPMVAVVDQDQVVQDFQRVKIGVAFEATGWNVRFLSDGIRLPEIDHSEEDKTITLPPATGEKPLPVTVMLIQPDSSYAKSVMLNIALLKDSGEPGNYLWSKFHEFVLDPATKSVEIPLSPVVPEGEQPLIQIPDEGLDFSRGFAFIIRPKNASDQEIEVLLKVTPKFLNPLDHYLELGNVEFDTSRHKLRIPIRRRSQIPAEYFPPPKVGAEINFSRDLNPFRLAPPPKRPEITENFEILESNFAPEIHEAIRISETTIGKDRLEFGLSIGSLKNVAKWRLSQSEEMERIGYARSGNANNFGNRTEIRIGMNLANPKDDGVQTHNLKGQFVLGEKWQNAILDFPLEFYGYQAEQLRDSILLLNLVKESSDHPDPLAEISLVDAYERNLNVTSEKPGIWQFHTNSESHGKFGVNLFESYRITEGIHKLEATLIDESTQNSKPIASYQTELVIEDSAPIVKWGAKEKPQNEQQIITSKDYFGYITVEDAQTGVDSVAVGLDEKSMTTIDLKGLRGETKPLKIPFKIDKLFYPEIPAKNVPIRKRITVQVIAKNSIGMVENFSEDIVLIQPAANMSPENKMGSLLVTMSSRSVFDFELSKTDGKIKRELPGQKGKATFDDLPEGNYLLKWKQYISGGTKQGNKSMKIEFNKPGETFNLAI